MQDSLDLISSALLEVCKAQGTDMFKTPVGTVIRKTLSRYWMADWQDMYGFIKENEIPELLEKRVHQTNMKQWIEEHPDNLPAGLQIDSKYGISVRKPKAS